MWDVHVNWFGMGMSHCVLQWGVIIYPKSYFEEVWLPINIYWRNLHGHWVNLLKKVSKLSPSSFSEFISQMYNDNDASTISKNESVAINESCHTIFLYPTIFAPGIFLVVQYQNLHSILSTYFNLSKLQLIKKCLKNARKIEVKTMIATANVQLLLRCYHIKYFCLIKIWYSEKRRGSTSLAWCDEYLKEDVPLYLKGYMTLKCCF